MLLDLEKSLLNHNRKEEEERAERLKKAYTIAYTLSFLVFFFFAVDILLLGNFCKQTEKNG